MDWFLINGLSEKHYDVKFYLYVDGETIRGCYKDYPNATHYATLGTVY